MAIPTFRIIRDQEGRWIYAHGIEFPETAKGIYRGARFLRDDTGQWYEWSGSAWAVVAPGAGSLTTVKEVDTAPTVIGVTELQLDEGDGFVLTDLGGGVARLDFVSVFTKGGVYLTPTAGRIVPIWRSPFACTATAVRGFRVGGSAASVNARRNGTLALLAVDLSLAAADTWYVGGSVQNGSFSIGDYLEVNLVSVAGGPTEVVIQVDLTRP